MSDSDESKKEDPARDQGMIEDRRQIPLDDILRARLEGAFVSPCGTEGARWEGFPEWPEEFPYDVFLE